MLNIIQIIMLFTTAGNDTDQLCIELSNDGSPAELMNIENLRGNITWVNDLPEAVKLNSHFSDRAVT